jgi:hypothetical protein
MRNADPSPFRLSLTRLLTRLGGTRRPPATRPKPADLAALSGHVRRDIGLDR